VKTFHLITYGCQMNIHDSERIAGVLQQGGWREVRHPADADLVIFLTCCVRESAEERFWGRLNSLAPLKEKRGTLFAVGGCYAQLAGNEICLRAPWVDLVFGTTRYPELTELIARAGSNPACDIDWSELRLGGIPLARRESFRAWIPVITGCDNFCSYCVVPYVRGREASRPREEILEEVDAAVSEGAREVVLLGQNVDSYGRDRGEKGAFSCLLHEVAERWPQAWIRFLTSHPRDFGEELVRVIREHKNICRYIHLPLQAGSDRILRAMRRGYTLEEYLEKVELTRRVLPDAAISTDLMVGYPGEEEEDFEQTLQAVRACRFDSAYTFIYNPRPGTAAATLKEKEIPADVKRRRLVRLAELVQELSYGSNKAEVGKVVEVLVEGESPRSRKTPYNLRGRTRTNRVVNLRGKRELVGEVVKAHIARAGPWSLYADQVFEGGDT